MFAEDLTPFFDTVNGFAETVIYQGTASIDAIFDNAFAPVQLGDVGVESTRPACLVKSNDVPNVVHGHTIKRGATTYQVVGVQPDGAGATLLILEKQ